MKQASQNIGGTIQNKDNLKYGMLEEFKRCFYIHMHLKYWPCQSVSQSVTLSLFGNFTIYKYIQIFSLSSFSCLKDLEGSFRYPLAREGVTAPGGHVCLANSRQKFSNIVGLTALRLAFFMGYE